MASLPPMVELHQRTLQRRLVHLRERVRKVQGTGVDLAHDKAEAAALDWALSFINEYVSKPATESQTKGLPGPHPGQ